MKYLLIFCLLAIAGLVFVPDAEAQTAASATGPYQIVEIEKFVVAEGVEFPETDLTELMSFMIIHFNKSRRFEQVFLMSDSASQTAPARRARVSGTVTKYSKGNRAARYLIGFGAGRTKLVADIKVVDAETGSLLFEQKVDGHVYIGFFGGETEGAKSNLATEIIKTMTKKGHANKERLKDK
jgi:hypothetical protein